MIFSDTFGLPSAAAQLRTKAQKLRALAAGMAPGSAATPLALAASFEQSAAAFDAGKPTQVDIDRARAVAAASAASTAIATTAAAATPVASTDVSGQTILLVAGIGLAAFFGIKKLREKN